MAKVKKSKAQLQAELNNETSKAISDTNTEVSQPLTDTLKEVAEKEEPAKPKGPGKIAQILAHFKAGMSTKEIAKQPVLNDEGQPIPTGNTLEDGNPEYETFHPTTISIQVNKYKKANPDLFPPVAPAPTKKEIAAAKKAEKEAAEKSKQAAGAEAIVAE